MEILFDVFQTFLGVAAGLFIAAPIGRNDQSLGFLMIVISLVIGVMDFNEWFNATL